MHSCFFSCCLTSRYAEVSQWLSSKGKLDKATFSNDFTRACVEYKIIDSQQGAERRVGFNHLVSNEREWNNCFVKNNNEKLVNLADLVIFFLFPLTHTLTIIFVGHGSRLELLTSILLYYLFNQSSPSCSKGGNFIQWISRYPVVQIYTKQRFWQVSQTTPYLN